MANMVKLTIDGKTIEAPEGTNLIDAAALGGIHIPNLCYLKGVKGIGACRLCLVEVGGLKSPMIACTAKVKEGMTVNTKTEKVQEIRKFVIDLILSMHPLDCMTCTKAGVCNLQQYAYDFEIKESSFTRKKFGYPVETSNPFIKRDPDYCVLCGRCVRVCKNQGTNVLEFMGRGVGSKVTTANDQPLRDSGCTFCGSCVDACPVNALLEADRWRKGREWDYDSVDSVCLSCGNGCDISVSTKDDSVMKVSAGAPEGSAEHYICAYGRFGFDSTVSDNRVTVPMKRVGGQLKETTWKDALDIVAAEIKKAGKDLGLISTAGLLNEDALTMKLFASEAAKTKNVDTTVSLYGDAASLISNTADIDSADLIVLADLNPSQWKRVLPALDAIIRKKVQAGVKLITVNGSECDLASIASVNLTGNEAGAIKSIAKALVDKGLTKDKKLVESVSGTDVDENAAAAAALIAEAKSPVIFSSPAIYQAAANLGIIKGVAVSVPFESNAKGVVMMGLGAAGKSYKEMMSNGSSMLYVVGEIPVTDRAKTGFLVVQHSHLTELAKKADVVLPAATIFETSGTIIDFNGRLKKANAAVTAPADVKTHRQIFVALSVALGSSIKESKESDTKKLANVAIEITVAPFARREGLDVRPDELFESVNASVVAGSRLIWLKEAAVAV